MTLEALYTEFSTPGEVLFNLKLVNSCNFACGHCMYSCKPLAAAKEVWMSTHVLNQLLDLAGQFINKEQTVTFNLIGGEPTKNLKEFRRILDYLLNDSRGNNITFEMTTNGWWLRSYDTLCEFALAVGPHIDRMAIRLSNSDYHDKFRSPVEKQIFAQHEKDIKAVYGDKISSLERVFTYYFDYYSFDGVKCPKCAAQMFDPKCQECKEEMDEDDYYSLSDAGYNLPGQQWLQTLAESSKDGHIYIDRKIAGEDKVSPVGRAAKNGIGWQETDCWDGRALFTFEPTGDIQGVCCVGGSVPLGNVDLGAWPLFVLAREYVQDRRQKPACSRCSTCSYDSRLWIKQNKAGLLQKALKYNHESTEA